MADCMCFNLFFPWGHLPPSAEMSSLSHHSSPWAKVCLQASQHVGSHLCTSGQLRLRCLDGSKTTKQCWALQPSLAHFSSQLPIRFSVWFPAQCSAGHDEQHWQEKSARAAWKLHVIQEINLNLSCYIQQGCQGKEISLLLVLEPVFSFSYSGWQ